MHSYFVIFPHAGAIRSNYALIEREEAKTSDVIYVDYSEHIGCANTFDHFIESIWVFLNEKITDKNADVYIFAHSMGNSVVQALESRLVSQYYISKIIYSDGEVISDIKNTGITNKSKNEINMIIDEEYDIPEAVKQNDDLYHFFQKRLVQDISIMDLIPEYMSKIKKISLTGEVQRVIALSKYMNREKTISQWDKVCDNQQYVYVDGGHYTILSDFSKYVVTN